jgi:hypothetical protein
MARHEYAARALWTDRTFNHLAGGWRLELGALIAALCAVGMILVIHCDFGDFGLRLGQLNFRAEQARGRRRAAQQ